MMRKTSRPFSFLVAVLAVCMFAAVGYRVGQSTQSSAAQAASTWQDAAAAAYAPARAYAYRIAWRHGYRQGWNAGIAAGASSGRRAGRAAGRARAAVRTTVARALAAALAATPVKIEPGTKTERCIEVAGGLCEALGPRITGKRCPPGSVADPKGGVVCVPGVLLLAARMTDTPTVRLFTP
jgi:hypothetical protein